MKNLIYILIFLPSLLFSQETKNMELVGVRNITINSIENSEITFEIQEGHLLKVLSATHGDDAYLKIENHKYLRLNGDYIISIQYQTDLHDFAQLHDVKVNYPFFLPEGVHTLEINIDNLNDNLDFNFTGTLYGLEFKLTTP